MNRLLTIIERAKRIIREEDEIDTLQKYTADIASELLRLKNAAGIASIRQGYKGTGSQRARRQLWIKMKNGKSLDIWLDYLSYRLGAVARYHIPGTAEYANRTPAEVAKDIADKLAEFSKVS